MGIRPADPHRNDRTAPSLVVCWTILQLAPLALAAARVQLWARSASGMGSCGLDFMLSVQLLAIALLFPRILRDWTHFIFTLFSATAFLELAGLLDRIPATMLWKSLAVLWLWIAALWVWKHVLMPRRWEMVGSGSAAAIVCSVGILRYLRLEFTQATETSSFQALFAWIFVAILVCGSIILWSARRATRYPQVVHGNGPTNCG